MLLLNILALVLAIGVLQLWRQKVRSAIWLLTSSVGLILVIAVLPISILVLRPLEQWHSTLATLPGRVDGVILLGSAQNPQLSATYGRPSLGRDPDTVMEFMALARTYPKAILVFSGGAGRSMTEAEVMRRLLARQGLDATRVIFEERSLNTYENARFSKELVQPKPNQEWLLITSALHMPRSVAVFEKQGWRVIPHPVSHQMPPEGFGAFGGINFDVLGRFSLIGDALHEWFGLVLYWITGRI